MGDTLALSPVTHVGGTVRLPGSKSISNRTLLLASLARGVTHVRDVLAADDTRYMLDALGKLGVDCTRGTHDDVVVHGAAGAFPVKSASLFLGNAGTAFRPMTAVLAVMGGEYELTGTKRMHERPIGDLVAALTGVGAQVDYLGEAGYPPLAVHPATLRLDKPVRVRGNVSSQFATALLMALPLTSQRWTLEIDGDLVSKPYVEMTLKTMERFGVHVERRDWSSFDMREPAVYQSPGEIYVEGDASAASYFLAAGAIGALSGGAPVRVEGVGRSSIQGDVRFTAVLERMGARVSVGDNWIEVGGTRERRLRAIDMDLNEIPDAAMTAAVAALFGDGTSVLRNIGNWRVKETDRLSAMAIELRKLGAVVEEGADFLRITPPSQLTPNVAVDTYDDHRIAMSFSLAALGGVPVRINDPQCVAKTFPDYFAAFASIAKSAG